MRREMEITLDFHTGHRTDKDDVRPRGAVRLSLGFPSETGNVPRRLPATESFTQMGVCLRVRQKTESGAGHEAGNSGCGIVPTLIPVVVMAIIQSHVRLTLWIRDAGYVGVWADFCA